MEKKSKRGEVKDDQVFVWQGYTGKVELISFRTFLDKPVKTVALGEDHSLILTYDDCLFTCGSNEYGQLGLPHLGTEYSFDPCLVENLSGKGIQTIACGTNHSGCIFKDGNLFCWGSNEHGQCGEDPAKQKSITSPMKVPLSSPEMVCGHGVISPEATERACQVSCGAQHSVALSASDKVWVWGLGPQLGLGEMHETWKPTVVKKLLGKKVISMTSGSFHNILLVEETNITRTKVMKDDDGETKPDNYSETNDTCLIVDNHFCKGDNDAKASGVKEEEEANEKGSVSEDKTKKLAEASKGVKVSIEMTKLATNGSVGVEDIGLELPKDKIEAEIEITNNAKESIVGQSENANVKVVADSDVSNATAGVAGESICDKSADESFEQSVLSNMVEQNGKRNNENDANNDNSNLKVEASRPVQETVNEELVKNLETDKTDSDKADLPGISMSAMEEQGVEMRKKSEPNLESSLTLSIRSDTSMTGSFSGKYSRSKSFLDEAGTREFLARQFEDDDLEPSKHSKLNKLVQPMVTQPDAVPSPPSTYMMQTMTSLTNQVTSVTSHMTSMTTKALSSMVPEKLRFSSKAGGVEEETKSSTETLDVSENSELEGGSSENINLDNSILDLSNLTYSDTSINTSVLSLPDSEMSFDREMTPDSSPVKERGSQSTRKSVSKESQSIRTIEAKQENLRKSSQSLLVTEEQEEGLHKPRYTMDTEVWVWGKNTRGQLGLGDMVDRNEPYCIQILTGKRIVKVTCGAQHTLALTSTGEVYSWGLNLSGQLGHSDISSSPGKIELTYDCCVWDVGAGKSHSIFLMDNVGTNGSRPDVFYSGKHPCKDLYVPIYKTPRLTPLKFVKKAGWIRAVMTGGDNCACLSRKETEATQMMFDVTRFVRRLYLQLHKIVQVYIKRLQISGYYTSLDVFPFKPMMSNIMTAFIRLAKKIGVANLELTDFLRRGETIVTASLFTKYDEYIAEYRKYSFAFADMVAVGGFEYCTKNGSSTFEKLQEFYTELLLTTEDKPNHAAKFRQIMFAPLNGLKDLSKTVHNFSDLFEKPAKEHNLLTSVHLNLEHLIRTSNTVITDAENTRAFWDSASSKISDSLRVPNRRLVKESRSSPLTLSGAGRFSSHNFYLFNDLFIHSQYSSYQSYPLETVWIDTPTSESSSHQHLITMTTPEDVLSLNAHAAQVKTEWVVAFNTAINKVLARQKSVNRQNSGERVHTPVIRYATHKFTKHAVYKDATYKGYWLNGKVHGSGVLKWSDGKRYKGKFKQGSQTGYGKLTLPKDNNAEEIQEGVWKDGKLNGHGKIKYSTGDLYDGYFKEGLRHGHGVYRKGKYLNSASFVYVGEWLYDKKHGYGVMDDILKGEKYMGMWQDDNRHGDGVVVTLDGMYFEGNFQNNKLVGSGLMLTDDNSCYEGEFAGITMLQGKGTLTFPIGDRIEGTFNGTWNQGLKITGTFHKMSMTASMERRKSPSHTSLESKSSLYGKLCVRPDRKWEEIFYQCYDSLHYSGQGEPNIKKAWDQVVTCIVAGKHGLKDKTTLSSKQKLQLSNLDQLEKIPTHSVDILSIEHYSYIVQYLQKAFETRAHPLGRLIEELVDVFRAAYIGIGAHPRLLFHAVQEIESFIRRIFKVIRILFPELPQSGTPFQIYSDANRRPISQLNEGMGFIQRQISETLDADENFSIEVVSAAGLLQPILLPKIYPALFDLYALHSDREDEKYWERVQKLNKQGDMSLMAYLGIDATFWCIEEDLFRDKSKRLSSLKDHCYSKSMELLQQLSTAFCPKDKLAVIEKTFATITQTVQEFLKEEHMWCMDDLFPIFQFVVIRARIHHLGAEISFIEDLMESHLENGEYGIMFTTMKACYYQIQNEKMPIH